MSEESGDDPWAVLSRIAMIECEGCGHQNSRSLSHCEECDAELDLGEDEGPGINILTGGGRAVKLEKTPLDKAKHLATIRKLYEQAMEGTVSDSEYKATVTQYYQMVNYAHEYLKSNRAKSTVLDDLQAPDRALADRLLDQVEQLYSGLSLMKKYIDSKSLDDLQQGFLAYEAAMLAVSKIQGDAYDRANSFDDPAPPEEEEER